MTTSMRYSSCNNFPVFGDYGDVINIGDEHLDGIFFELLRQIKVYLLRDLKPEKSSHAYILLLEVKPTMNIEPQITRSGAALNLTAF
jgi:hypothetical protein